LLTPAEQEAYTERWCICVEGGYVNESIAHQIAVDTVRGIRAKAD